MPKAVYRTGCRDKHNRRWWDSNLGPLKPQSDALTTRPLRPTSTASAQVIVLYPFGFYYHLWIGLMCLYACRQVVKCLVLCVRMMVMFKLFMTTFLWGFWSCLGQLQVTSSSLVQQSSHDITGPLGCSAPTALAGRPFQSFHCVAAGRCTNDSCTSLRCWSCLTRW